VNAATIWSWEADALYSQTRTVQLPEMDFHRPERVYVPLIDTYRGTRWQFVLDEK
jgi:hypothetical protein